jgi:hypothetical protein
LEDAIHAKVLGFDILEGVVTLGSFSYLGSSTGFRRIIRVQPEQSMPVLLRRDDMTIHGSATDLSLTGIGVSITNMNVKKGEAFQVMIVLPSGEISILGKVIQITPQNGKNRLAIKFESNSHNIALIMKYMTGRRMEIQDEIERLYTRVLMTAKA